MPLSPAENILNQATQAAPPEPQATPPEPQAAPPSPTEATPAAPAPVSQVDPYLAQQYQALQAQVAQERQRNDQVELALVQNWINSFPADSKERAQAESQAQVWYLQKASQAQIEQERAARAQAEGVINQIAKEYALSQLSQKHGIPLEVLKQYGQTPQVVEAIVRSWGDLRKRENFQKRVDARIDTAPQGAGSQSDPNGRLAEIKKQFSGSGNIRGYLKAVREAGLTPFSR